jgi:hypothetical protein
MGHSTGGGAAIFLAIRGSFVVSTLGLIVPATFVPDQFGEISNFSGSALVISGTNDTGALGAHGEPLMIFDAAKDPNHLVQINGANHFGYTDSVCIKPLSDGVASIS